MSLQDHQPDTSGFYNLCIHLPLALVEGRAPLLIVAPRIVGAASGSAHGLAKGSKKLYFGRYL